VSQGRATLPPVLSPEEVTRRLKAARELRGIEQQELDARLHELGEGEFGKNDAGRIERGQLAIGPNRRRALSEILGVPDLWWTAEELFGEEGVGLSDEVRAQLTRIESALRLLLDRAGIRPDADVVAELEGALAEAQSDQRSRGQRAEAGRG